MPVESISIASLCLFDCIRLSMHFIFNNNKTNLRQYYIKSMAQHEMLRYYRDCLFVVLSGNVAYLGFVRCAPCVVWIVGFSHSRIPTDF
jgi:hypothetical protein